MCQTADGRLATRCRLLGTNQVIPEPERQKSESAAMLPSTPNRDRARPLRAGHIEYHAERRTALLSNFDYAICT